MAIPSIRARSFPVLSAAALASFLLGSSAFAVPVTWDGGGLTNNWSDGDNWSAGSPPASGDDVIFDATSSKECIVDITPPTVTLSILASFTGTVTGAAKMGVASWSQAGGIFAGGAGSVSVAGAMTLSGGVFTAPGTASVYVGGNVTVSGGTAYQGSGTVYVAGSYTQTNGVFAGGSGPIRVGVFVVSGGVFTSTSGVLTVDQGTGSPNPGFGVSGGGIFNHNGGVVDLRSADCWYWFYLSPGAAVFNEVWVNAGQGIRFQSTVQMVGSVRVQWMGSCGGRLELNGQTMRVGGDLTVTGGNYFYGNGTVVMEGGGAQQLDFGSSGSSYVANLTVTKTGGAVTVANNDLDVNGNVSIGMGALNLGGRTMRVSGNWTNVGVAGIGSGTVILDGGNQTVSGQTVFENLTKVVTTPQTQTLTFAAGMTQTVTGWAKLTGISGNLLSLRSSAPGTQWNINPMGKRSIAYLDVQDSKNTNAASILAYGTGSVNSGNNTKWVFVSTAIWDGGGLTNNWSEAVNWSNNTVPASVAVFDGTSGKPCTIDIDPALVAIEVGPSYAGTITSAVAVSPSSYVQSGGTFVGGSQTMDVLQDFALIGGSFTATTGDLRVGRDFLLAGGAFAHNGGTVRLDKTGGSFSPGAFALNNLTIDGVSLGLTADLSLAGSLSVVNGGTFTGSSRAVDVNGSVSVGPGGSLTAPTGAFTVAGDWSVDPAGVFSAGTGLVTLDGGGTQRITGASTFYNLKKNTAVSCTLFFGAGESQVVKGVLDLKGAAGSLLCLRSNAPGTRWQFDPQGARAFAFLDVRDSHCVNALPASAVGTNSRNTGNNLNWIFHGVTTVGSLALDVAYKAQDEIVITVGFSSTAIVTGEPHLALETGTVDAVAVYSGGSGTTALRFSYVVQPGDTSGDLDYPPGDSLVPNGGTMKDPEGYDLDLTLPLPGTPGSLGGDRSIVVDTAAPLPAFVAAPPSGTLMRDNRPALSGTAEADSTVEISDSGSSIGSAKADGAGNWSHVPAPLADGTHVFTAVARDAAGNVSATSNSATVTIDTAAPAAPAILAPVSGSTTNVAVMQVAGTSEVNSRVEVFDGVVSLGTTGTGAGGEWGYTPGALAEGMHVLTTKARDAVGNLSGPSNTVSLTVDTVAPAAPAIVAPVDGTSTNNPAPAVSGTAEPLATVRVFDGAALLGSAAADGAGNWAYAPAALADGGHSFTADARDGAGNTGPASAAVAVTVDTGVPAAPVITAPPSGTQTAHGAFTLTGTGEANATIAVHEGAVLLGSTAADGGGNWHFTTSALGNGLHSLTANARDAAGNESGPSAAVDVTVDTAAPAAPVISSPADGTVVSDATPQVTGTSEALDTVEVFDGAASLGTTTANGAGNWSFTAPVLSEAAHTLTAKARDGAGNESGPSNAVTVTVDTTVPGAPSIASPPSGTTTNDSTPALAGTAEALGTVEVFDGAASLGTAKADGAGAWSMTAPALADGAHSLTAKVRDAAGNESGPSAAVAVTVDTAAPAAPVITSPLAGSVTGYNTPSVSGIAEANGVVEVLDGPALLGAVQADGAGAWSLTPPVLADGPHTFTARCRDKAGNTGGPSAAVMVTIDTTAPAAPVIVSPATGAVTNDNTPAVAGTAEPALLVEVRDGAALLGSVAADGAGNWAYTPAALADGAHSFTARARDAAGNAGPASATVSLTVDTVAPAAPVISSPMDNFMVYGRQVVLAGTAEANSTVVVQDGGTTLGGATADGTGRWTFAAESMDERTHRFTATARDAAGNTGPQSSPLSVRVGPPVDGLAAMYPYPNPARAGARVRFTRFAGKVEIRIFTLSGRHVVTLSGDGLADVVWDLSNAGGGKVGPGTYVWLAQAPGGGKKTGRLVVDR